MTVLQEGDIQITVPSSISYRKFDGEEHGLSHCMKAVDFILDLRDRYIFIEIKDPQNPNSRNQQTQQFVQSFSSGKIDDDFKVKYRDSFIYEYASGRARKDIYYYVLIAFDKLKEDALLARTEALKRIIPLKGPNSTEWQRPFIKDCAVFNIRTWKDTKELEHFPIQRISS